MKRSLTSFILAATAMAWMPAASAEIYKIIDENGRVTYTNVPTKGAQKLDIDPPPKNGASTPSRETRTPSPSDFPRVDRQTQSQRDDTRRKILLEELEAERKALEEAKKAYEEGASKPEVYRGADGKTYRNVAKFEEKMKQLQANVDAHEKNIELLQKELEALK
ncbi:MAG TPA: DUF4124 domain-containing protein [Methylophilaceae bacterium]|jgi:exonuclease VII small subunit